MISEGSCDTEDKINETENFALPAQEFFKYIKTVILNCNNISQF